MTHNLPHLAVQRLIQLTAALLLCLPITAVAQGDDEAIAKDHQARIAELETRLEALETQEEKVRAELAKLRGTGETEVTAGFQKTRWGMSPHQVKRLYPKAKHHPDGFLYLERSVGGHQALVVFHFVGKKLSLVGVAFTEEHANNNLFIDDFVEVSALLNKKYGEPTRADIVWSNDLFRDDPSHHGNALAVGHVLRYSTWELPTMKVEHSLSGDNYKVRHAIRYVSTDLAAETQQEVEAERLEDF